jgi:hypothetical protein
MREILEKGGTEIKVRDFLLNFQRDFPRLEFRIISTALTFIDCDEMNADSKGSTFTRTGTGSSSVTDHVIDSIYIVFVPNRPK